MYLEENDVPHIIFPRRTLLQMLLLNNENSPITQLLIRHQLLNYSRAFRVLYHKATVKNGFVDKSRISFCCLGLNGTYFLVWG